MTATAETLRMPKKQIQWRARRAGSVAAASFACSIPVEARRQHLYSSRVSATKSLRAMRWQPACKRTCTDLSMEMQHLVLSSSSTEFLPKVYTVKPEEQMHGRGVRTPLHRARKDSNYTGGLSAH